MRAAAPTMPPLSTLAFSMLAGAALDRLLGEPQRFHPLVGFGRFAGAIEARLNRPDHARARGVLAWLIAVSPWLVLVVALGTLGGAISIAIDIGVLALCLGARSLGEHARAVAEPLAAGDLDRAREHVGWIVSRDTAALSASEVAAAGTESVLENGNDAIFATLFWFAVGGAPGALLFRLANTLDAMWGYRNARFARFGSAAARIDDALGWAPARLTAASYALLGHTRGAWRCWRSQAPRWKSPNAGPVMAAGAGALGVQLGGPARYHGQIQSRPMLGDGPPADSTTVHAAIRLVERSLALWLALAGGIGVAAWLMAGAHA